MKVKNKEEVISDSLEYFHGDQLAAETFLSKYSMLDNDGNYESTPNDMHRRMAKEYARIEEKFGGEHKLTEDEIYNLFKDFKYIIPGGSVMSGLGNPNYVGSLSNCFVIGQPEDSYASIMKYRDYQVELMKRRGGVGVDLSKLRPEGTRVNNAARTSTGPVSFMTVFSELTKEVALNGRRGALMISISGNHPDVEQFIECKQDLTKITGANISVKFSDAFMSAVEKEQNYILRWPVNLNEEEVALKLKYIEKENGKVEFNTKYWLDDNKVCLMMVRAKDIWNKFVHCAWNTAEPGIMYEDKHWNLSPDGVYEQYKFVTTNPCGEVGMGPFDSCRLMHINLASFANKKDKTFDYDLLEKVAYQNMQLCDDLVELELEHVQRIITHIEKSYTDDCKNELELWKKIYETGKSSRRAGCGATGIADAVALLGIKLNSEEGFDVVRKIFQTKMLGEIKAQIDMAKERGTFIGYDFNKEYKLTFSSIYKDLHSFYNGNNNFFENLLDLPGLTNDIMENMQQYGRRNVSWSTMAPVGTGAIMTQGTSGIEPLFMPYYKRRKKCMSKDDRIDFIDKSGEKFTEFMVVHKPLKDWIVANCKDYNNSKAFDEQASEEQLEKWFKESPWYQCTAADLTPVEHTKLQSISQRYTTLSISKTCNLPNSTTEEEISELYMEGWKQNCKGLTVYRDGCRDGILIKTNEDKDCHCKCNGTLTHSAPKRPKSLPCDIKRFRNGGDKWIACVGLYQGQPYEIFTGLAEKLNLPENIDKCAIIKNKVDKEVYNDETGKNEMQKVSSYDLMYSDKDGNLQMIENIGSIFRSEFYNVAKMTSGLLRHGMPIDYIISLIKSLDFKNDTINSWKSGVIRALKVYIKDGEIVGEVCPECGAKIIRENGCKHCSMCSWSACS